MYLWLQNNCNCMLIIVHCRHCCIRNRTDLNGRRGWSWNVLQDIWTSGRISGFEFFIWIFKFALHKYLLHVDFLFWILQLRYGEAAIKRAVPLALGLISVSNPKLQILDTLSKFSHDSDPEVAHNAILAMGIAGAGRSSCYIIQRNICMYS